MSNDLMTLRDGTVSFAENGERESAWHGLGQRVAGAMTAREAIQTAHLDGWNVRCEPVFRMDADDQPVVVDDRYVTVADIRTSFDSDDRETRVFDIVGSSYVPIQNESAFAVADAIVDASGAHYETAGALGDGRKVFLSMRLPEGITVKGEDAIDLYLVVSNAHAGQETMRLLVSPVRVVCANTLAMAMRDNKSSFAIRHTRSSSDAMREARAKLSLSFAYGNEFAKLMDDLSEIDVTDKVFADLVSGMYPTIKTDDNDLSARAITANEAHVGGLMSLWNDSATMRDLDATAYRAYNAFTEYWEWYASVRNTTDGDEGLARAQRAISDVATKQRTDFVDRLLSFA